MGSSEINGLKPNCFNMLWIDAYYYIINNNHINNKQFKNEYYKLYINAKK